MLKSWMPKPLPLALAAVLTALALAGLSAGELECVKARAVIGYTIAGLRPWGLALSHDETLLYVTNGLSNDISIIETATGRKLADVPVGEAPYAVLSDDQ